MQGLWSLNCSILPNSATTYLTEMPQSFPSKQISKMLILPSLYQAKFQPTIMREHGNFRYTSYLIMAYLHRDILIIVCREFAMNHYQLLSCSCSTVLTMLFGLLRNSQHIIMRKNCAKKLRANTGQNRTKKVDGRSHPYLLLLQLSNLMWIVSKNEELYLHNKSLDKAKQHRHLFWCWGGIWGFGNMWIQIKNIRASVGISW